MSVTRSGTLDQRRKLVTLVDVLPPAWLRPSSSRPLAGEGLADGRDLVVGVRADLDLVVLLAFGRLFPLGSDHQAVLARQHGTVGRGEDLGQPLVHGTAGEVTDLVVHADQGVAAGHPRARAQRVPPLPERSRIEGVDASERVAFHLRLGLALERCHFILADEGVPADQVRGGDRPTPPGAGAVGRVAPEGIVVAVGLGDVAKGILIGAAVSGEGWYADERSRSVRRRRATPSSVIASGMATPCSGRSSLPSRAGRSGRSASCGACGWSARDHRDREHVEQGRRPVPSGRRPSRRSPRQRRRPLLGPPNAARCLVLGPRVVLEVLEGYLYSPRYASSASMNSGSRSFRYWAWLMRVSRDDRVAVRSSHGSLLGIE